MSDSQYSAIDGESCITEAKEPQIRRIHLYTSVAILNIIYLVVGTTFTWSSPMLIKLHLSSADASTIASSITLGGIVGPFMSGLAMDRLGRKRTAAVAMTLLTCSYLLLTVSRIIWTIAVGRCLAGIAFAITFSALPTYIAEISEDSVRGVLNTVSMISMASGGLLMFCVAPFVSYELIHYILLGICALFFLLFPVLPESPYQLVMKNQLNRAKDVLTWLRENRSESSVQRELLVIQKTIAENESESSSVVDLFTSKGNRRSLATCCILLGLQQFTGITIIIYYLQVIFEMTGAAIASSTCSTMVGVIKFGAGFLCPLAVKHYGYKKPMIASAIGSGLGMAGLGVFFYLKFNGVKIDNLSWLPVLSVIVYISFFVGGSANIPWAMTGELFPSNVKSIATCLITASCSLLAFFTTKLFPDFVRLFGLDYLFMTCSFFCFVSAAFIALAVKETCGLSFAEIQELLNGRKRAEILLQRSK